MRHSTILGLSTIAAIALSAGLASAQSASEAVHFNLKVHQPALFDTSMRDTFSGSVDDRSGTTNIKADCSAGASGFLGMGRVDEACSVTGNGLIKNPNNAAQTLQRVNISGGYKIDGKKDGYTDGSTILVEYVQAGPVAGSKSSFGGNLVMLPENPSASALALGADLFTYAKEQAIGTSQVDFSDKIDSVSFENFKVPGVLGAGENTGCSWTGDWIYSYAADSWAGDLSVDCNGKKTDLKGTMPLRPVTANDTTVQTYEINLVIPGGSSVDPFAAADPFATVDGIKGTLTLKNSGRKTEKDVYTDVEVSGDIVGTNVPLELVRGWGEIMIVLGRTFYGA